MPETLIQSSIHANSPRPARGCTRLGYPLSRNRFRPRPPTLHPCPNRCLGRLWPRYAPFRQFILGAATYLAEDDRGVVGFAGLETNGHVASVYVRQDCIRQGVGSYLLSYLLSQAQGMTLDRLYAEASHLSLGLFLKHGFCHYATETVERDGVTFDRYLVEKRRPF